MKLLFPLLITAAAALAQNPGRDLKGWSVVTWGMTVAEASAALGPAAVPPAGEPGPNLALIDRLVVRGLQLGTIPAEAAIQTAPRSDRVTAVTILAADLDASPARRAAVFGELKRLLIEKYATPKDEQTKPAGAGNTEHTALWIFPATSITLTWSETTPRYGLGYVTIRYQAVDKKALDIL